MALKSLLLSAVVFVVGFNSFVASISLQTKCEFLTFGQELDELVCIDRINGGYCCYNAFRKPYCCDQQGQIINIVLWVVAFIGIICGVAMLVKVFCPIRRRTLIFL